MKIYDPRQDGPLQPLVPHGLVDMGLAALGVLAILVGLCVLAPGWFQDPPLPAGQPPLPGAVTPAWYWLPLLGFFSLLPGGWGVIAGGLMVAALAALPFWARGPRLPVRQRPHFLKVVLAVASFVLAMFLWGAWRMTG